MAYAQNVERWRPLVEKYFSPEDVDKALWVIKHESGGRADAHNTNREDSVGLFQMNRQGGLGSGKSVSYWKNPENNIRHAAQAVYGGSGWSPWGENSGGKWGSLGVHPYPGGQGVGGSREISNMSQQSSSYQGSTYWSDRVDQINDQIQQLEDYRDVAKSFPRGDELVRSVDREIQNLQWMRDEAQMFAQEEQAAAADIALTGAQIDVQRINAAVAEGRLTLDQAIHELNKELDRRQQKLNEETMRRNQGRADAEFIQSELNEAAAWAPSEPGKTDYSGADVSQAHGQVLEGRGISPDATIAQYSGTRTVNPQQTLSQAGGGAKGSAPGMGWRDEDRTQPEGEPAPGAPATGGGAPGSSRSSVPPAGHPASTSPPPTSSTPNFSDSTPPTGHPAGRQPPNFSDSTPPMGHPAGSPAPQAPPTGLGRRPGDPLPTPPQYEPPNRARPTSPSHAQYRSPRFPDEDDGLLARRRRNSTPPPGHPAGAPQGSLLLRR